MYWYDDPVVGVDALHTPLSTTLSNMSNAGLNRDRVRFRDQVFSYFLPCSDVF
jgi:hypothetical protein